MADKFSIVIVCKNEAAIIEQVLQSIATLTDDIVVYDNGSTDGTVDVLKKYNVTLEQGEWLGFGRTKKLAVNLAKYDWVLSIDADEALDDTLQQELKEISFTDHSVYQIRFKNFFGNKYLRWGEWGGDKHIRLFNKSEVNWNDAGIHEELTIPAGQKVVQLKGYILHFTMSDITEYSRKVVQYAMLNAEKYFQQGKKASWIKRRVSPTFSFIKHYFFELGFLDGWEGLISARMTAFYTFLKYARLHELWKEKSK